MKVLELAKELHAAVNGGVTEWDKLIHDPARVFYITQAQAILDTYAMVPLDNVQHCSGCRTLTNALNDMDESRRLLVAGRDAVVKFLESATEQSLSERGMVEKVRNQLKEEDDGESPEDLAMALNLIQFVLDSENAMLATPAVTSTQEVPLDTP